VVFGKVTSGMAVVEAMEEQGTRRGQTKTDVVMSDCRVL
jgi:cyclophilin family peptidyl-prolyl cis-trans isomerase